MDPLADGSARNHHRRPRKRRRVRSARGRSPKSLAHPDGRMFAKVRPSVFHVFPLFLFSFSSFFSFPTFFLFSVFSFSPCSFSCFLLVSFLLSSFFFLLSYTGHRGGLRSSLDGASLEQITGLDSQREEVELLRELLRTRPLVCRPREPLNLTVNV